MENSDNSERPNQQRYKYVCVNFDQPKYKVNERNIYIIENKSATLFLIFNHLNCRPFLPFNQQNLQFFGCVFYQHVFHFSFLRLVG